MFDDLRVTASRVRGRGAEAARFDAPAKPVANEVSLKKTTLSDFQAVQRVQGPDVASLAAPRVFEMGPIYRANSIADLKNQKFDVLVVGGGIVGTRTALDASSRGLKVALVEKDDFASGTSSQSSKLGHGGVRYMMKLAFALVAEGLRERNLLFKLSPHLAKQQAFDIVLDSRFEKLAAPVGLSLYDGMGRYASIRDHSDKVPLHKIFRSGDLKLLQYYDGLVDDARLTANVARTAAEQGASVVSRVEVTGYTRENGEVTGATVKDHESGETFNVRAKNVVMAGGVWTPELQSLDNGAGELKVKASKGVHVVVRANPEIDGEKGELSQTEKSVFFDIPFGDFKTFTRKDGSQVRMREFRIKGTTDTPYDEDKENPTATQRDIDYVLEKENERRVRHHISEPISKDEVLGVYSGLRPLVQVEPSKFARVRAKLKGGGGDAEATSTLSRNHEVRNPESGLYVIAGGKLTNARRMAEDVIDEIGKSRGLKLAPSRSAELMLVGGDRYVDMEKNHVAAFAASYGVTEDEVHHLLDRVGDNTPAVLGLYQQDPALREQLAGTNYTLAEARFAASHEGALHVGDVLRRRTRASILTADRGAKAAEQVARAMAPVLGWDEAKIQAEAQSYRSEVEREIAANLTETDGEAAAVTRGESA